VSAQRNFIRQTISNTPGVAGGFTLSTAVSGFLGLEAGDDGLSFDLKITEGTSSEARTGCVYTHGSTSLTRGTLEKSTTGAAVNFTSAAIVSVVATAASGTRWDSAGLVLATGADANTTLVPDTTTNIDLSTFTADRDYTLPTNAAVGQEVELLISVGSSTRKVNWYTGAGQTLAYGGVVVAAASLITSFFISGENPRVKYLGGNKWTTVRDGRIPCSGGYSITSGSAATGVGGTIYLLTAFPSAAATAKTSVGFVASGGQVTTRRAGVYSGVSSYASGSSLVSAKYAGVFMYVNGAIVARNQFAAGASGAGYRFVGWEDNVAAGQTIDGRVRAEENNMGVTATETYWFVTEKL
jgi:hypothetical protein